VHWQLPHYDVLSPKRVGVGARIVGLDSNAKTHFHRAFLKKEETKINSV